ncbi:MAG TPA: hypothetical protein DEA22_01795, partial [Blastocatellia bacterium]|nr:hypothetical protein [Blastocatellia bacterium]
QIMRQIIESVSSTRIKTQPKKALFSEGRKINAVIALCLAALGFVGFLVFVSPETWGQKQMDGEKHYEN